MSRLLRGLTIFIAIVVVVFVAADRISVGLVEAQIGKTIQENQHLPSRPSVKISGFPFLTQAARQHFTKITFRANEIEAGGANPVEVASVVAELDDVRTSHRFSQATAAHASGVGTITYASLSKQLNTTISWGGTNASGRGRLKATETVSVLGQKVSGSVTAQIQLASATRLGFSDVAVLGVGVPQVLVSGLEAVFAKSLSVAGLPAGLSLSDANATPTGVELTLVGTEVLLRRP